MAALVKLNDDIFLFNYQNKMSLIPYSRENMRAFKVMRDEEENVMKKDSIVKKIYSDAVMCAENGDSLYRRPLGNGSNGWGSISVSSNINNYNTHLLSRNITKEYVVENMDEIIMRLRSLFPDCAVEYKKVSMARGRDGKEYDISTLDDKLAPFIDVRHARTEEYIVIDWS